MCILIWKSADEAKEAIQKVIAKANEQRQWLLKQDKFCTEYHIFSGTRAESEEEALGLFGWVEKSDGPGSDETHYLNQFTGESRRETDIEIDEIKDERQIRQSQLMNYAARQVQLKSPVRTKQSRIRDCLGHFRSTKGDRTMKKYIIGLLAMGLLLTGCAKPLTAAPSVSAYQIEQEVILQQEIAFTVWNDAWTRLLVTAYPLQKAAVEFCTDSTVFVAGFISGNVKQYDEEWQIAAASVLQVDARQKVLTIYANSPAAKAGLQVGDYIKKIDGEVWPLGDDAKVFATTIRQSFYEDGAIQLDVIRNGTASTIHIALEQVCNYEAIYRDADDTINAYADGANIYVNRGFMQVVDDEQLAVVIAHEIAHNTHKHIEKQKANALGGRIAGTAASIALALIVPGLYVNMGGYGAQAGAEAFSQEFESEADYVGLYIMARAGLAIDNAANVWRILAAYNTTGIKKNINSSHPSSAERFVRMGKVIEEVKGKISNGEALIPNVLELPIAKPTTEVMQPIGQSN